MAAKRKRKQAPAPVESSTPARRWVTGWQLVTGFAIVGIVLGSVIWLGQQAASELVKNDRYAVRIADIVCESPPGLDRSTFLAEVRYLGGLPEVVHSVEPGLEDRLRTTFAAHPWVRSVSAIHIAPGGGEIQVVLQFRIPVLAVSVVGDGQPRAVDSDGVLLPQTAPTTGLPVFIPPIFASDRPAGQRWGDPDVHRAASLAADYKPKRIERTTTGWRITQADGTVATIGS